MIGWIGSPYNTRYLQFLEEPLRQLSLEQNIRFRVIGGRPISFAGVEIENLKWEESAEASMLAEFDIVVMPLPDSPFERGKCGYKLIQYMACGKPAVGSPVGVNARIVTPACGFLCTSTSEWYDALLKLVVDERLRTRMGTAGRQIVEQNYCIQKTGPQVVSYLKRSFGMPNAPTAIDVDQPVPAEAPAGDPLVSK